MYVDPVISSLRQKHCISWTFLNNVLVISVITLIKSVSQSRRLASKQGS